MSFQGSCVITRLSWSLSEDQDIYEVRGICSMLILHPAIAVVFPWRQVEPRSCPSFRLVGFQLFISTFLFHSSSSPPIRSRLPFGFIFFNYIRTTYLLAFGFLPGISAPGGNLKPNPLIEPHLDLSSAALWVAR